MYGVDFYIKVQPKPNNKEIDVFLHKGQIHMKVKYQKSIPHSANPNVTRLHGNPIGVVVDKFGPFLKMATVKNGYYEILGDGCTDWVTVVVINDKIWLMYDKYVTRKPFYEWMYDDNHLLFKCRQDLNDFYTTWVTAPKYGIKIPEWLIKVYIREKQPDFKRINGLKQIKLFRNNGTR